MKGLFEQIISPMRNTPEGLRRFQKRPWLVLNISIYDIKKNILLPNQEWEHDPEMYGVRRSGRSKKEPSRLNVQVKTIQFL